MNITAFIIAGGKSSRMGKDKAFLDFEGKMLIEHQINLLSKFTDKIIINANKIEKYLQFGLPIIRDLYDEKGKAGGIYTCLRASTSDINILVPCDTPLLSKAFFNKMLSEVDEHDCFIPQSFAGLEPLCAVYKKSARSIFLEDIQDDKLKISKILDRLNTKYIYFKNNDLFLNVNTPEDYEKLKKLFQLPREV
jgi:molybdopterin-guanine dinucleotide biosynthesis protein A